MLIRIEEWALMGGLRGEYNAPSPSLADIVFFSFSFRGFFKVFKTCLLGRSFYPLIKNTSFKYCLFIHVPLKLQILYVLLSTRVNVLFYSPIDVRSYNPHILEVGVLTDIPVSSSLAKQLKPIPNKYCLFGLKFSILFL